LTNEKYIGNNIFNRVSYKLKQRRIVNRPDTWVRADGVFPSIVDRALFERARAIIDQRGNHYSDEELLSLLQAVLEEEGSLSGQQPLDYYILPSIDMNTSRIRMAEDNALSLDAYRFESLDFFYSLATHTSFREAA
jgi:hypothetical protein